MEGKEIIKNSKELFVAKFSKNLHKYHAEDPVNENLDKELLDSLEQKEGVTMAMYDTLIEFSALVNELSEQKISILHSELEKARELLRECQDRFETILVIGVERDEVNILIKKLNILQNPSA